MSEVSNATVQNASATPSVAQLNLVPPPSQAELDAAQAKAIQEAIAKKNIALTRFDNATSFKLEAEVIGRATKKTVSKSGAVKMSIQGKKELGVISGLSGADLDAWTRMRKDELKAKQSELAARLSGDNNYTGAEIVVSAKGDAITMKWKKAAPITVGLAEPTDEQAAAKLGISLEELNAFKAMKAAKAEADKVAAEAAAKAQEESDAKELAKLEEEERLAQEQMTAAVGE